ANNLILGFCFLLGSLLVIGIHHTFANLSGLKITAVHAGEAFAGDLVGFTIRLSATNKRLYYALQLQWGEVSERIEVIEDSSEITLYLRTEHRGRFFPPRLKITTFYPLGLLRAWTWLDLDINAIVYPKAIASDELPAGAGDKQEAQYSQRRRAGIEDFEQLKNFTEGDPLAHVSWKHLARGQGMLVKTYSEPVAGSNTLDYQAFSGLDKEGRLSRLAWWVVKFTEQQQPFALKLPHTTVEMGAGNQHQQQCLRALALFEESV
ncbi:MAG TPA: DUF58 domain-containing protein, partial [Agitococcus sp.]|nr:DUF58 domain-containing protein [Agitococcus sp.]